MSTSSLLEYIQTIILKHLKLRVFWLLVVVVVTKSLSGWPWKNKLERRWSVQLQIFQRLLQLVGCFFLLCFKDLLVRSMAMGIYRSGTIVAQELLDQVRSTGQYTITAITTYCTAPARNCILAGRRVKTDPVLSIISFNKNGVTIAAQD